MNSQKKIISRPIIDFINKRQINKISSYTKKFEFPVEDDNYVNEIIDQNSENIVNNSLDLSPIQNNFSNLGSSIINNGPEYPISIDYFIKKGIIMFINFTSFIKNTSFSTIN